MPACPVRVVGAIAVVADMCWFPLDCIDDKGGRPAQAESETTQRNWDCDGLVPLCFGPRRIDREDREGRNTRRSFRNRVSGDFEPVAGGVTALELSPTVERKADTFEWRWSRN